MADLAVCSMGSPSLPSAAMDELAQDNRRLQDMLHHALRREAEALRKLKHLSQQLAESRPPPSPIQITTTNGSCFRADSPSEPSSLSQGSDCTLYTTRTHGASSQPNSPSHHLSPTVTKTKSNPDLAVNGVCLTPPNGMQRPSSAQAYVEAMNTERDWDQLVCVSPGGSLYGRPRHISMLAPSPRDLKDVRTEREKPPPLHHRSSTPERPLVSPPPSDKEKSFHSHNGIDAAISIPIKIPDRRAKTLERLMSSPEKKSFEEVKGMRPRSRTASSMLRPNWLKKKRTPSMPRQPRRHDPKSFDELFSRFLKHASILKPDPLSKNIGRHWSEVCGKDKCVGEVEKYRDAVWDLFQSECKYLTRQLRPLEQIYKAFLEELHFYGILKVADTDKIFANLSELCELSASVASDLFRLFEKRSGTKIAPTGELIRAFSMFGHKFNPVYQRFCVNFEKQRGFVKALEQLPDFQEYIRVCRGHKWVARNDLTALLIAPMQHQCHYQLLLEKVVKNTQDPTDKGVLSSAIKAFGVSLKELEGNILEHKRSLELLELQETVSWPSIYSLDPDAFIPECLVSLLCVQPVLASKDRQLLMKGSLKLLDNRGRSSLELFVFLFTDLLLLTEDKKKTSKRELTQYLVYRHPLLLNSLEVHDVPFSPSHKNLLTLVEKSSLQQSTAVYSLQAATTEEKDKWLHELLEAQDALWHRQNQLFHPNETAL